MILRARRLARAHCREVAQWHVARTPVGRLSAKVTYSRWIVLHQTSGELSGGLDTSPAVCWGWWCRGRHQRALPPSHLPSVANGLKQFVWRSYLSKHFHQPGPRQHERENIPGGMPRGRTYQWGICSLLLAPAPATQPPRPAHVRASVKHILSTRESTAGSDGGDTQGVP